MEGEGRRCRRSGRTPPQSRPCIAQWWSPTNSIESGIPLVVSSRGDSRACVIRVEVACQPTAGRRCPALLHRSEAAIVVRTSSPLDDVHAKRKGRIIPLSLRWPGCQNCPDRQDRHSQNTHRSLPRELMAQHQRRKQAAKVDRSQFTFAREPGVGGPITARPADQESVAFQTGRANRPS
jgi:hypothetical protein